MKILVTGFDLEQVEHRGIAVFSKNLLRSLYELGHEVWLLTEIAPKHPRLSKVGHGVESIRLIQASDVLSKLAVFESPENHQHEPVRFRSLNAALKILKLAYLRVRMPFGVDVRQNRIRVFTRRYIKNSPFINESRTRYLELLEGIASISEIFRHSNFSARRGFTKPFRILTGDFDLLIKTAPYLLVLGKSSDRTIEVVHDVIPLLLQPSGVTPTEFAGRLSLRERKLYISNDTRDLYQSFFPGKESPGSQVVIQPPSIRDVPVINDSLVTPIKSPSKKTAKMSRMYAEIPAFRYLLFNSSVEERKNVDLVIRAFNASNLSSSGYKLLIMGKLKDTGYCRNLLSMASPSVLFTDFVADEVKAQAFLLAACVVTASAVEGFGIPALDGACMGVTTLASKIPSHVEISKLHDFANYVKVVNGFRVEDWALAMLDACPPRQSESLKTEQILPALEERASRFKGMRSKVWSDFCSGVERCIQASGAPSRD